MGFSSALQSTKGHEQLLSRQDAELRLIDIMKRSMQQKAKCDREYAIGLANLAQQGLKIDRTDELQGSHITKAWRSFMDELEQTSRQLKLNADHLEAVCQDKLTQLYHDKRKARKQYQEEHLKISQQFTHITEDVQRKKLEYQKFLDNYKVLRSRFEEQFVKGGRSGRKIDDVADKYKKACRKLHLAHNEYVLLISEAIEIEKDFRTILLPGLLEHQQTLQEGFIQTWKNLLLEIVESGDLTSEKFSTIQRRIVSNVNDVNPSDEYKEFTEKHKTGPPTPTLFQFDESLIEDKLGKLQANTLTVDNLTHDWLRTKLSDLETSVKECQDRMSKYCNENGISAPSTPTMNGVNGHNGTKDLNKNSKDLQTLRCQERQMLKLVEIIKTALNEIGCEELPSGCDDVIDQSYIENNLNHDHPDTPHSSSYFLQKGAEVMSIFRTFRRKSGPSSPTRTPKRGRSSDNLGSSVISLDFREVMCADDAEINNANNNNAHKDELDNEEFFEDIDVDTNQVNNNVCYRSTNNIYVDIEEMNVHESLRTMETEVDDDDDYNKNLDVKAAEKNDSKNNLLFGSHENENHEEEEKNSEETILKNFEKMSFTEKLKSKIKKSSSTEAALMSSASNSDQKDNLKDRFNRFKTTNYRSLSETESEASRKSFKKLKPKRKKLFRQLTEEKNLMSSEEKSTPDVIPSTGKKKSKSISSAIFSHIREMKHGSNKVREIDPKDREKTKQITNEMSNRLSEIKFLFETEAKDIEFEEIIESEAESLINNVLAVDEFSSMPPNIQITDLDEDEVPTETTDFKPNKFKFAQNIKSRLKLRLRKHKKLSETSLTANPCAICTKPKLHASPTVADFEKEFHTSEIFTKEEQIFCTCEKIEETCSESSAEITINKRNKSTNSSNSNCSMTISANRPLYEEEWFHGVLPREEVVRLLCNDGDFLVRETTRNDESQTVLSVCWTGHKHFIVQTTAEGFYRFEGPAFPSIQELILHQYQSELPVTSRSGAVLKKPVLRERWELSNDDVILLDKIGRGNFGDVYKAKLKSSPKKEVAVKTCRMTLPDEQKRKFLQEGRILKQYDHPNIVKLIGICVQKQPIMIVMELVPGGSLLNFLRKNAQTLVSKQLLRMCRDAAAGMQYLESKNCIHRDLAARNCLIGDDNIVKISDFGMSREEEEYIVSDGMKQIPIKWTAPEALNFGKYTSLCDVWSYGILTWEIFSKGGTPYSGMSNTRARERIDAGYRMPAPDNTPSDMYRLMLRCWSYEPESRPHFDEIYNVVDALVLRGD